MHVNLACTYTHYLMYEKDKLPKIISMKYEPSNFQTQSKNNNKDVSIAWAGGGVQSFIHPLPSDIFEGTF